MPGPSTADLSHQSPLWRWTHLPPPCTLLYCPPRGLPRQFSNPGLPQLLFRVARGSMAYRPPRAPYLLHWTCTCPSVMPHLIGGIGSLTGANHGYPWSLWPLRLTSLIVTSETSPTPLRIALSSTLLLLSPFQSLLYCACLLPSYSLVIIQPLLPGS